MPVKTQLQVVISAKDNASRVFKGMQRNITKHTGVLQKNIFTLNKFMALGLAAAGVAAVKMAADFDTAMRKVNVMARATGKEFQNMKRGVLDLSSKVGISATEMSEAMYLVVSSGFRGAESMRVLEAVAMGAAGGMANAGQTAAALTKALNIFGLSGEDATDIMDKFFGIVDYGLLSFEELAGVFPMAATQAAGLGVTFNEVGAALATLTKTSGSTNIAATSLNAVFTALMGPTEELQGFLEDLGFETGQAAIAGIGFAGILKEIEKRYGGNAAALKAMFRNVRAVRAVFPLVGASAEDFEKALEGLEDSAGKTNDAFEEMATGPGFRLRVATTELKNSMILLGDELAFLADIFVLVAKKMSPFLTGVSALGPATGKVITRFQQWIKHIDIVSSDLFDKLHLGALKPVKKSTEELEAEFDILVGTERELDAQLLEVADRLSAYGDDTRSATEIVEEHRQKQEELIESLENLQEEYEETGEEAEKAFKKQVEAVKEIRDEIKALYQDITEAGKEYTEDVAGTEEKYREKTVEMVADAEAKIKKLEKETKNLSIEYEKERAELIERTELRLKELKEGLAEAETELEKEKAQMAIKEEENKVVELKRRYDEDTLNLEAKIGEQEAILTSYQKKGLKLDKELAERKKYLAMNEMERLASDHETKLLIMQKEFLEDQILRAQRLIELTEEHNLAMDFIGKEKTAAINAEIAKTRTFREKLKEKTVALGSWVNQSVSMYRSYVSQVNFLLSQIRMPFPGGGGVGGGYQYGTPYVPRTGAYLLHRGEAVVPAGRTAGGTTVNILGGTYLSPEVAEEIGDMIIDKLKLQLRL